MTSIQCRYFCLVCKKRKDFWLSLIMTLAKQPALTNRHVIDKLDSIVAFCFLLRHSHKKEGKNFTDQKVVALKHIIAYCIENLKVTR